jgi:hypothetical protein
MNLDIEATSRIVAATSDDVERALGELSFPDKKFAVLNDGDRFAQAYCNEDETFTVEYSEGSVDRMFRFERATRQQALAVMQAFLNGADFRSLLPFERFEL